MDAAGAALPAQGKGLGVGGGPGGLPQGCPRCAYAPPPRPQFLAPVCHRVVLGALAPAQAAGDAPLLIHPAELSALCMHGRPLQGHCHGASAACVQAAHWGKMGTRSGLQDWAEGVTAALWRWGVGWGAPSLPLRTTGVGGTHNRRQCEGNDKRPACSFVFFQKGELGTNK